MQLSLDDTDEATLACRLTPGGRVEVWVDQSPTDHVATRVPARRAKQILESFERGRGHGVLHLAVAELSSTLPPELSYWRELGRAFRPPVSHRRDTPRE